MNNLSDIKIIEYDTFNDLRGSLWTSYNMIDLPISFNHDKVAISKKNVLRGLHADKSWKLITCLYGKIQLAVVNNIKTSSEYTKYVSFVLDSNDNIKKSILVPPYFLNGHLVLSDEAVFFYKWYYDGTYPDVNEQVSVKWNDPNIGISWLCDNPILSERDNNSPYII